MTTKVLNLYAGIGGNRKLWEDVDVTAVEWNENKAEVYRDHFPNDDVIVTDAHEYLLEHYDDGWDFIWASPPCPTHSRTQLMSVLDNEQKHNKERDAVYPDMRLYQEVILLDKFGTCSWVIENVIPYYETLIDAQKIGRHLFWSNFHISGDVPRESLVHDTVSEQQEAMGFDLSGYELDDKRKAIRNCVEPKLGKHVFDAATSDRQATLF